MSVDFFFCTGYTVYFSFLACLLQRETEHSFAPLHSETLTDVEDFLAIGDAQKRRAVSSFTNKWITKRI